MVVVSEEVGRSSDGEEVGYDGGFGEGADDREAFVGEVFVVCVEGLGADTWWVQEGEGLVRS